MQRSDLKPTIDALIEGTLSPYRQALGPSSLTELRALLSEMLASHPVAAPLVEEIAPRPVVLESGEIGEAPVQDRNKASGEER